jgi:hypothetical protein
MADAPEKHGYVRWDHCDECYRQFEGDPAGWDLALWQVELDDEGPAVPDESAQSS